MSDDLEIYRSAKMLIDQHGDDAEIQAAMMADEMAARNDRVGYTMWKLILKLLSYIAISAQLSGDYRLTSA